MYAPATIVVASVLGWHMVQPCSRTFELDVLSEIVVAKCWSHGMFDRGETTHPVETRKSAGTRPTKFHGNESQATVGGSMVSFLAEVLSKACPKPRQQPYEWLLSPEMPM